MYYPFTTCRYCHKRYSTPQEGEPPHYCREMVEEDEKILYMDKFGNEFFHDPNRETESNQLKSHCRRYYKRCRTREGKR